MKSDSDHSTKKRLSHWKLDFRAPIWMFMLIFIVAFLFGNFADEGYGKGLNQTCCVNRGRLINNFIHL